MIMITIPREFADRIPAARSYLNNVALKEPNFNGAEFSVEEGWSYSIDGGDEISCTQLYRSLGSSIGIFESED